MNLFIPLLSIMLVSSPVLYAQTDTTTIIQVTDSLAFEPDQKLDSILAYASRFVGRPYGYGSGGTKSFDCSGFVMHVYGKFGVKLPHSSGEIAKLCREVNRKNIRPGDLVFFSGRKISKKKIGHVALVKSVEDDKVFMIHATVQSGVVIEELGSSAYFSKRYIMAGRLRSGLE